LSETVITFFIIVNDWCLTVSSVLCRVCPYVVDFDYLYFMIHRIVLAIKSNMPIGCISINNQSDDLNDELFILCTKYKNRKVILKNSKYPFSI